jgi:hypothetical protein
MDESKPFLRQWYSQGFRAVRLKLVDTSCRICRSMRNAEFYIFNILRKDNPLFRITHPNCNCGFIPIDESHLKHDKFDTTTGYKIKVKEIAKPEAPTVPEEVIPEAPRNTGINNKIDQIEKEIETTEEKLETTNEAPVGVKPELTQYLNKLREKLDDLNETHEENPEDHSADKQIDQVEKEIEKTEEKITDTEKP